MPFRAGAAHVMPLGAIAGQQLRAQGAPEVGDGLADAWGFVLLGHDTFPSSRRVPTAGSAFWSRRMSAWFSDTMRPNWLKFVSTSPAKSSGTAIKVSKVLPAAQTEYALFASRDVMPITLRGSNRSRGRVRASARAIPQWQAGNTLYRRRAEESGGRIRRLP